MIDFLAPEHIGKGS